MARITREFSEYIETLVKQGGPGRSDYAEFTRRVCEFDKARQEGRISHADRWSIIKSFGTAVSTDTIQGLVVQQPRGYPGDYELMERIYTYWCSPKVDLVRWDWYFHAQAAAKAVRNRKAYLHKRLHQLPNGARVLNLGCGPGRCVHEWFASNPNSDVSVDCVDNDPEALEYARCLNAQYQDRMSFSRRNILRFRPKHRYNLIWCAGLFDYLDDRHFMSGVRRMLPALASDGEIVIGNFAVGNPTRPYMELGNWRLWHRSKEELIHLASLSSAMVKHVRVEAEPEGVNLFVHARAV